MQNGAVTRLAGAGDSLLLAGVSGVSLADAGGRTGLGQHDGRLAGGRGTTRRHQRVPDHVEDPGQGLLDTAALRVVPFTPSRRVRQSPEVGLARIPELERIKTGCDLMPRRVAWS